MSATEIIEKQPEVTHSPLPWRLEKGEDRRIFASDEPVTLWPILKCSGDGRSIEEDRANAALIVKCVNAYPRLVERLKVCQERYWMGCTEDLLRELGELE